MKGEALITGATGFVGRHLTERLLDEGWRIRALVRPTSSVGHLRKRGVELRYGDLGDEPAIREAMAGVETVFHLAAVTGLKAEKNFEQANVAGTRNVVEVMREAEQPPRRLVYLSSYAACGPSESSRPRETREAPAPLSAYGRTKLAGEEAVRSLAEDGVEVAIVRAPPVFGPGDHAFLPYFRLIRLGFAPAPAGGELHTHMIYVRDLALALGNAAHAPPGTYAVADPVVHRWSDVVDVMAHELGTKPVRMAIPRALVRAAATLAETGGGLLGRPVVFNREKAEEMLAGAWVCDLSGSEALLPVQEVTPLREGISETIRWYRRQRWL